MFEKISKAIQDSKEDEITGMIEEALDKGHSPKSILDKGMVAGMAVIGEKFKNGDIFIPEVMMSANTMKKGLEKLEPLLAETNAEPKGKVLIGTVKNDRHDIGKNIVSIMFKGNGFEVIDLGTDVSAGDFVKKAAEEKPDIIGLSALLTTTMSNMKKTVSQLKDENFNAYIFVGGAPVTKEFADSIGAEYSESAAEAIEKAKNYMENT